MAAADTPQAPAGPTVIVGADGLATLHVDQQPLAWVVERIAEQAKWPELLERAAAAKGVATQQPATAAPAVEAVADAGGPTAQRSRTVLAAMQRGTEPERWQALSDARTESVAVSDEQLRHIYETDASDRVRLEALESAVNLRDGDPQAQRKLLEVAQYVPNAAVQAEARRRLAEIDESQRMHERVLAMRLAAREQRQQAVQAQSSPLQQQAQQTGQGPQSPQSPQSQQSQQSQQPQQATQ